MNHHIAKRLVKLLAEVGDVENPYWTETVIANFPKKYERHGDMILFQSSAFSDNLWKKFDQTKLWECIASAFKVKRIAKQGSICSNGIRSPSVVMLLGEDTWVTHIDNKIKYSFDVTKCMFSSGNVTEKMRMSKLDCSEEIVVDMFTGIGYFTLPILVHAKAKHVHACEWNPDAVIALRKNLCLNKVYNRCTIYEGDNRKVYPDGVADRVLLGLIPSSEGSYLSACSALKPDTGGTLHIHCNVSSQVETSSNNEKFVIEKDENDDITSSGVTCNKQLKPEWLSWSLKTSKTIQNILNSLLREGIRHKSTRWKVHIVHVERVKSYAPHIDHLVLDLRCVPSV